MGMATSITLSASCARASRDMLLAAASTIPTWLGRCCALQESVVWIRSCRVTKDVAACSEEVVKVAYHRVTLSLEAAGAAVLPMLLSSL